MLDNLINDLRSTSKPIEKQNIVQENHSDFLKFILIATFEPFKKYHVKIKPTDIPEPGINTLDDEDTQEGFRKLLAHCELSKSNKQNRTMVVMFLALLTKGSQDLVVGILNKNWKVGLSHKTANKIYPGAVTSYEVQLANSYLKVIKKKTYKPKSRWCSYKLDGVRCTFLRFEDGWQALSRQGKEFLTVDHLKEQLEQLWLVHGVDFWDGELYVKDAPFEYIQGMVMRFTKGTAHELEFRAFICGSMDHFLEQICEKDSFEIVTQARLNAEVAPQIIEEKQWMITEEEISSALEDAFELGLEGIMLRDPDKLYDFKRSDALLKLKENDSEDSVEEIADCLILDIVIDSMPVIINETMIYKQLLTKLIVEQANGLVCNVGSGFSLDFRYEVTENPELVLKKVGEFKFQGYGSKGKMRFPRLFRVRDDLIWGD
jgi:DNA ligase-1